MRNRLLAALSVSICLAFVSFLPASTASAQVGFAFVDAPIAPAYVGVGFIQNFYTQGGTRPISYSVVAGSLPAGLSLAKSTTLSTTIASGTPKQVQTSTFTVQAKDKNGQSIRKSFTIVVSPTPPVVLVTDTLPNGVVGQLYEGYTVAQGGLDRLPSRLTLERFLRARRSRL
jgi:Putative Ig domain